MAKKEPKEFRIENILAAAIDEFTKKGYDGASIDAIAAKAGVSKGGFYYHFTNKEHLLMEVNSKLNEPVLELMEKALSSPDSVEGFKQYMIDYIEYWIKRPKELSFLFLSMSKALELAVLSDYYKQSVDGSTTFYINMLQRINDAGHVVIQNIELSAISLMGSLDGIISYVIVHPDLDIESLVDQLMGTWLRTTNN
jgi:AcrR family transcriptional regulator